MSLNYWPNLALVLFLLFVYLESKEIVKRQQPSTELVQILKSRSATVMPSSQSWDEYGNIVINGRMAMSSSFAVISQIKKEAALSVVICRQGAKAKCEKPGLVLCYETHYLFDDGEIDRKDEFFKYVSEICAGDSGFVVTTENEDVIRIDTRFGNTYRVKLKTNDNCIILWLSYDILSEDEKESFLAHKNYPVYPITHSLDQQKPNNTGLGPEYVQNWNLVPKAENKELIKMFWKEIHVQPKLDEIYSTVLFSASGGDPCCALTAKIMGHEVVKCYMKWENMGTACVAPDIMGHKHECQVSAVLGYDNYTKIWMSNDTSTGMSESKKRSFYEMVGQIESSEMAVETFNETMKETRQALSEKYDVTLKEPDNSEIKGHLDGRLEANFELIEGELNAEGNLELIKKSNKNYENLTKKEFLDAGKEMFKQKKKDIQIRKFEEKTKISVASDSASTENKNAGYIHESRVTVQNMTRSVVNTITYPTVLQMKQLISVCYGFVAHLNITAGFTNDNATLQSIAEYEQSFGHPKPSAYDSCPFFWT